MYTSRHSVATAYGFLRRHWAVWLCLLTVGVLSACGFALRQAALPVIYSNKTLATTFTPESELGRQFARSYTANGGKLVQVEDKPDLTLLVLSEAKKRIPVSITRGGLVREYRLSLELTVQLKDAKGQVLMPTSTFRQQRQLSFNESEALAKEYEDAQRYRDMRIDLVQQLLYRLAAVSP